MPILTANSEQPFWAVYSPIALRAERQSLKPLEKSKASQAPIGLPGKRNRLGPPVLMY